MSRHRFRETSSGCVDTPGFMGAGVHCDVRGTRDGRLDLAMVVSRVPCTAAGMFTRNRLAAAPVRLCREALAGTGTFRGFVANSGNANACTGKEGCADATRMRAAAAEAAGMAPRDLLVCSTGRIGRRLPMDRITTGLKAAAEKLGSDPQDGLGAADAILTSDMRRKVATVDLETSGGPVVISGMAKGAGMIEPNMATMLAFICTDAAVSAGDLQSVLGECVAPTFNAITVDGDESTNDTVLAFANGESGVALSPGNPEWMAFSAALHDLCQDLAMKIVGDGEKITKVVEICIENAATDEEAALAARAVANSLLVKSSWYGNDPNWGRVMDAVGYSGAVTDESSIRMWYVDAAGGERVPAFVRGAVTEDRAADWKSIVSEPRFGIVLSLGSGDCGARVWSTDLTEGYVNFNKSE